MLFSPALTRVPLAVGPNDDIFWQRPLPATQN
jgi:hypothetical protein